MEHNVGAGLVDFLVTDQEDHELNQTLYNWGVINDESNKYKNFKNENTIKDAMYIMKATNQINSELYAYAANQLRLGRLKLLIDERVASNRMKVNPNFKNLTPAARAEKLMPFTQTSVLQDQLLNMVQKEDHSTGLIKLEQSNKRIPKDKVSALIYALSYCKDLEDNKARKNHNMDMSKMMFFTPKKSKKF